MKEKSNDFRTYERIRRKYRSIPSAEILRLCMKEAGYDDLDNWWAEILFEILSDLLCCRLDWQQAQEMFEEYGFEQEAFDIFKEIVEEFYPYV